MREGYEKCLWCNKRKGETSYSEKVPPTRYGFHDKVLGYCEYDKDSFYITNEMYGGYSYTCEHGRGSEEYAPTSKVLELAEKAGVEQVRLAGDAWKAIGKEGMGEKVTIKEARRLVQQLRLQGKTISKTPAFKTNLRNYIRKHSPPIEDTVHKEMQKIIEKYNVGYKADLGFIEFPRPAASPEMTRRIIAEAEQKLKELGYKHYDVFEHTIIVEFPGEIKAYEEWKKADLKDAIEVALDRGEQKEIFTPREFRGILSTNVGAIETSCYRILEHLRTGVPLDRELIERELQNMERILGSLSENFRKVQW